MRSDLTHSKGIDTLSRSHIRRIKYSYSGQLDFILLALAIIAILLLNPVGYIGGGKDDARYVAAARCWAEYGACLPQNHWDGRWPIFAPIAAIFSIVGENRFTAQLWAGSCSLIAAFLFIQLSRRILDNRIVAAAAGVAFVTVPAFALQLLTPSVEAIELALIFAAIVSAINWSDRRSIPWALASGLCLGMAFQVRETALSAALLIVISLYITARKPRLLDIGFAAAGFLLPLVIEFVIFQILTGDFLYRRNLSLNHVTIPSSELPVAVSSASSPLLNSEIIGGWRREPGVQVHWLIDGPLNLILNAHAGFSLLLTPILMAVGRKEISPSVRKQAWLLLALAAAHIAIVNFVFAMDPKPRVMLVALAASSMAFGLVAVNLWNAGRKPLIAASAAAALLGSAIIIGGSLRPVWATHQAVQWVETYPNEIEIDGMTRMMLTLSPKLRQLPGFGDERPFAMTVTRHSCRAWPAKAGLPNGALSVSGEKRLSLYPSVDGSGAWICLFRYRADVPEADMRKAVDRAWGLN